MLKALLLILAMAVSAAADERVLLSSDVILADKTGDTELRRITYRSDGHGWEYKVGDVVERRADGHTHMHLPTLRDFASYDFLNNHCFHFGGIVATRDGNMVRIDFAADVQIRNRAEPFASAKTALARMPA